MQRCHGASWWALIRKSVQVTKKMGSVFSELFQKPPEYFNEEQLRSFTECTYFTDKEINKLYKKFQSLSFQKLNGRVGDGKTRITFGEVVALPDLRQCPFSFRLCQVFSTDAVGINFEDFLDMMSVFSHRAPWNLKAAYAFRIFDFNEDSRICFGDIETAIRYLTGKCASRVDQVFSTFSQTIIVIGKLGGVTLLRSLRSADTDL